MAERSPLAFALVALLSAACFGPSAPLGVPCAMNKECPGRQMCNLETNRCEEPSDLEAWYDDTAADFGAEGTITAGTAVEAAGFVGPVAYFVDGLRYSGIASDAIPSTSTTWTAIVGMARTGTTLFRGIDLNGPPPGIGLPSSGAATVLVEGEIYLRDTGTWRFQLDVDDIGFVDLAAPGSTTFQRIAHAQNGTMESFHEVTTSGWHRLRGAFARRDGDSSYKLRAGPPGSQNATPIAVTNLRAPAGDVTGLFLDGFEDPDLFQLDGSAVHADTLVHTFGADPYGIPVGDNSYSLHFAGQMLIDVGGTYTFRVSSRQGHRMWIAGTRVANQFDATTPAESVTAPLELEAGWHDIVVDLNRSNDAMAQISVIVDAGPARVGETIPLDHLRPVVGRAIRMAAGSFSIASSTIPETGSTPRGLGVGLLKDMRATQFDFAFKVTHQARSQVEVRVDTPSVVLLPFNSGGSGDLYKLTSVAAGTTTPGSFTISARDNVADLVTGTLSFAGVNVIGFANPPPLEAASSYISAPRDLGVPSSIARVRWKVRQERPDLKATVSMRTCDAADACDGEAWAPVTYDGAPDVPARRFAQYKLELASDGDVPTALDWIEIRHRPAR